MILPFLKPAAGPSVAQLFATTLYTGNGSNRTITSGIDADLVWIKGRSGATDHALYDTARGATIDLVSNATSAETTQATGLTAFSATGFDLGALAKLNTNLATYAAWSFGEVARFFDVVTFTSPSSGDFTFNHNLGIAPGLVIVKSRGNVSSWNVYHRSLGNDSRLFLQQTAEKNDAVGLWGTPTSTTFTANAGTTLQTSQPHVAYLFAHDVAGDGIVQCGSYTGNGSATGPTVTLGWNPQFVMIKRATGGTGDWVIFDTARGIVAGNDPTLCANSSAAENGVLLADDYIDLTGTGFQIASTDTSLNANTAIYVYVCVRAA